MGPMERRVRTIVEIMLKQLKKTFPCARKLVTPKKDDKDNKNKNHQNLHDGNDNFVTTSSSNSKWLLQLLLLSPDKLIASISPVLDIPIIGGSWPCKSLTAGLA